MYLFLLKSNQTVFFNSFHKQVAQLEQSLKIITENQDLARMQSSIASIVRKYFL